MKYDKMEKRDLPKVKTELGKFSENLSLYILK